MVVFGSLLWASGLITLSMPLVTVLHADPEGIFDLVEVSGFPYSEMFDKIDVPASNVKRPEG